jgi:hypothetical protein
MFPNERTTHSHNLAARMGRWSADHWKTATFGWLALVVAAVALGGMVGTTSIDQSTSGPGESGRMDRILEAGFKQPAAENILIQSRSARVGTAAFDSAIADVVAEISKVPDVQSVRSPLAADNADLISTASQSRSTTIRASRSASSATRAPRRESRRRTPTTSARRACSRFRSRSSSSSSRSALSWRQGFRSCSR